MGVEANPSKDRSAGKLQGKPAAARRIALTGGIASGKSTVSDLFRRKGAVILDGDQAAREAVRPGTRSWRRLRELLGPDFFLEDGELDRRRLRLRIIDDPSLRAEVNAVLYPAVMEIIKEGWREACSHNPQALVLFDIPLLYEAGLDGRFDRVILVYAPPEVQVRRLMERDGVSREEAERTLAMQMSIDRKRVRAHLMIDNGGSLEATRRQVDALWRVLAREVAGAPKELVRE